MLLQELHIYSEQSSSNTKVSIKNKDGEILFEYCYSNDAIPTFNPIELLRLSLEGDIGVLFQMKTSISQKSKKDDFLINHSDSFGIITRISIGNPTLSFL